MQFAINTILKLGADYFILCLCSCFLYTIIYLYIYIMLCTVRYTMYYMYIMLYYAIYQGSATFWYHWAKFLF